MVTVKHFLIVKSGSTAMLFWKIGSFEEVDNRVAEAALIIVLNVYYCFVSSLEILVEAASHVPQKARTLPFSRRIAELWQVGDQTYHG